MMLSKRNLLMSKSRWLTLFIIIMITIASPVTCEDSNETGYDISTEVSNEIGSDETTDLETKEESYPSIWSMIYDFWNWMLGGYSQNKNSVGEPRTFGKIRRLQMAMIPLAFKFGVITAMITFLVFLAVKSIFLLKLILLLNAGAILAKILLYKAESFQHQQPVGLNYGGGWSTVPLQSWSGVHPLNKEVHLHIHGNNLAHQGWGKSDQETISGYGGYLDVANELTNQGPLPYLRASQATPTLYYPNSSG